MQMVSVTPLANLLPEKELPLSINLAAGWTPQAMWTICRREKTPAPAWIFFFFILC
jgi:hypothetical protein